MNENNELLLYIYQNAKMGVQSCTDLIRILNNTDNKIKKVVEGELKGYEEFVKKSEKLLKKNGIEHPKDKGMMAELMTKMGMISTVITKKVIIDLAMTKMAMMKKVTTKKVTIEKVMTDRDLIKMVMTKMATIGVVTRTDMTEMVMT